MKAHLENYFHVSRHRRLRFANKNKFPRAKNRQDITSTDMHSYGPGQNCRTEKCCMDGYVRTIISVLIFSISGMHSTPGWLLATPLPPSLLSLLSPLNAASFRIEAPTRNTHMHTWVYLASRHLCSRHCPTVSKYYWYTCTHVPWPGSMSTRSWSQCWLSSK